MLMTRGWPDVWELFRKDLGAKYADDAWMAC